MNAFELYNLAQMGFNVDVRELTAREVLLLQMVGKEVQHKAEREAKLKNKR